MYITCICNNKMPGGLTLHSLIGVYPSPRRGEGQYICYFTLLASMLNAICILHVCLFVSLFVCLFV